MADVSILYHESEIASLNASGSKVLTTHGKFCDDDITVEYTKPSQARSFSKITTIGTYVNFDNIDNPDDWDVLEVAPTAGQSISQGLVKYVFSKRLNLGVVTSMGSDQSVISRIITDAVVYTQPSSTTGAPIYIIQASNAVRIYRLGSAYSFDVGIDYTLKLYK